MKRYFKYSTGAKVTTIIGLIAMAALAYVVWTEPSTILKWVGIVALVLLVIPILVAPLYQTEDEQSVHIRLLACSITLRKDVWQESPSHAAIDKGWIRLCGSGGFFGFTGYFWSSQYGACWLLVTNPKAPCRKFQRGKRTLVLNA